MIPPHSWWKSIMNHSQLALTDTERSNRLFVDLHETRLTTTAWADASLRRSGPCCLPEFTRLARGSAQGPVEK